MRKMSDKTQKFLKDLAVNPDVSVNSLAKKHKIAAGYAYKLAKKRNGQAIEKILGPRPAHLPKTASTLFKVDVNMPIELPANEVQVGGEHYKKNSIQPWDYIVSNQLGYLEGNVVKYVSRWKDKGGRQDLEKAKHYLDKLLEVA
jgi:hypothetical protein